MAFISVATHLAFLHYSKVEHDLRHAKRDLKKIEEKVRAADKELAELLAKSFITEENVELASKTLMAEFEVVKSSYLAAAAVYADANIHARRDDINAAHLSLVPPVLEYEIDDFNDVKIIISSGSLNPVISQSNK